MKKVKYLLIATLVLMTAACGTQETKRLTEMEPASEHDGTYIVALYNDVGECVPEAMELTIKIKNGIVVDSEFDGVPISGTVTGNLLEAFIDAGNGATVDIEGKFSKTLTGNWKDENAGCYGYFSQNNEA